MGAETSDTDLVAGYRRYRSRTVWALWPMAAGLTVAIVFWRPEAWSPTGLSELARDAGAAAALLAAVLAFRWNAMLAERIGFCQGKHGCHPRDLTSGTE